MAELIGFCQSSHGSTLLALPPKQPLSKAASTLSSFHSKPFLPVTASTDTTPTPSSPSSGAEVQVCAVQHASHTGLFQLAKTKHNKTSGQMADAFTLLTRLGGPAAWAFLDYALSICVPRCLLGDPGLPCHETLVPTPQLPHPLLLFPQSTLFSSPRASSWVKDITVEAANTQAFHTSSTSKPSSQRSLMFCTKSLPDSPRSPCLPPAGLPDATTLK